MVSITEPSECSQAFKDSILPPQLEYRRAQVLAMTREYKLVAYASPLHVSVPKPIRHELEVLDVPLCITLHPLEPYREVSTLDFFEFFVAMVEDVQHVYSIFDLIQCLFDQARGFELCSNALVEF
jgi:hypothetical protein